MWPQPSVIFIPVKEKKKYTIFTFIWDVFWTCFTGGFWLIYVFVREMRAQR